jgi:nicotinamidase/pyrazinamidase
MAEQLRLSPGDKDVLIVVDVQYDFLPGGALAVPDGDAVIAPINRLAKVFRHVVLTQDWHTPGHASFASSHAGKQPFETTELHYGTQVLWPDHCIQGTFGAEISRDLKIPHAQLVIRKGYNPAIDSYSGFVEADRETSTGLAGYLMERGFKRVFCAGLATDFCVAWTALDAKAAGFETYLIEDASRAIDAGGSLARAQKDLSAAGVHIIGSAQIEGVS